MLASLATVLMSIGCVGTAAAKSKRASIAVDANTGEVLQEASADAPRYPASLTKMMTLYMVFEQMEAGKLNGKTRIRISKRAESVSPSKLDLKPGETIALDDAIKALVTKSANDVAVAIAEHIGGSEYRFAQLMTAKARQLGMRNTTFRNASGLPNDEQVTTARDMIKLALHLMDDFPRHYKVFSTRRFSYDGKNYRNHNRLLFSFKGTDGIKTGYTRASGFNLVASVHRDGRHVVAAVFGGSSSAARNSYMTSLLHRALKKAKTRKTRKPALVASAAPAPKPAQRRQIHEASAEALPWAGRPEKPAPAAADASAAPRIDVAKVRRVEIPPRPRHADRSAGSASPATQIAMQQATAAARQAQPAALTDPRAALGGPARQPSTFGAQAAAFTASDSGTVAEPVSLANTSADAGTSLTDAIGGMIRGLPPSTLERQAEALSANANVRTASLDPSPVRDAATPVQDRYQVQVGAYNDASEAERRLAAVAQRAPDIVGDARPMAIPVQDGPRQFFRARFAGFDSNGATDACQALQRKQIDCFVMKAE